MVGRHVWQGLIDWFRTSDRSGTGSHSGVPAPMPVDPEPRMDEALAGTLCLDELGGDAEGRELLDFLSADVDPIPADPVFRERLREELWRFVQHGDPDPPERH